MVPPTRVVSTAIWGISWGNNAEGYTHPWRASIIPHGLICIRVSIHWVLTVLLSLSVFHLISVQIQFRI